MAISRIIIIRWNYDSEYKQATAITDVDYFDELIFNLLNLISLLIIRFLTIVGSIRTNNYMYLPCGQPLRQFNCVSNCECEFIGQTEYIGTVEMGPHGGGRSDHLPVPGCGHAWKSSLRIPLGDIQTGRCWQERIYGRSKELLAEGGNYTQSAHDRLGKLIASTRL